jgi:hypothetical protein
MENFEYLKCLAESYKKTTVEQIEVKKDIIIYPIIIRHEPQDTLMVNIRPQIRAIFDEDMDEKTINEYNMIVTEDQTKMRIYGKVTWNSSFKTAIFEPKNNLSISKKYKVMITREVKDKRGIHLKEAVSWSFFTAPINSDMLQ